MGDALRLRPQIESDANAANNEVDLLLEAELESEDCDELADVDLAHELLLTVLEYDAAPDDTAKVCNTARPARACAGCTFGHGGHRSALRGSVHGEGALAFWPACFGAPPRPKSPVMSRHFVPLELRDDDHTCVRSVLQCKSR